MSDPSRRPPVQPGELLAGKYRVEWLLGQGGMGVVVAATHTQLDKLVALKFMLSSALADKEAVERFLREARSAVQLTSEHVARVLDVGTLESGAPYIVMELLEGRTLEELLLECKQLPVGDAVEYVLQVCEAVAEAHARNIVHRDLKPANLFLTRRTDGKPLVKVLDFGLSKIIGPDARNITRDLAVMGTPAYMSPEQLRSTKDVDTRADLWSLGVILNELVAGQSPFHAASVAEVCSRVLNDPPRPLCELAPDAPEGLALVIERALQKDPAQRYQDVATFAEGLEPFVSHGSVSPAARIRRVQFASVAPPKWSKLATTSAAFLSGAVLSQKSWLSWAGEQRPQRALRIWSALAAVIVMAVASLSVVSIRMAAREASASSSAGNAQAVVSSAPALPALAQTAQPRATPSTSGAAPAPSTLSAASAPTTASAPPAESASEIARRPIVPPARSKLSRDKLLENR